MTIDYYDSVDWDSVANDLGVPIDCLVFLYDALFFTPQYSGEEPGDAYVVECHSSAAEFCQAFLLFARDSFGDDHLDVLNAWGISKSEALGRIVFELVRRGLLEARPDDTLPDFDGQFDLT